MSKLTKAVITIHEDAPYDESDKAHLHPEILEYNGKTIEVVLSDVFIESQYNPDLQHLGKGEYSCLWAPEHYTLIMEKPYDKEV